LLHAHGCLLHIVTIICPVPKTPDMSKVVRVQEDAIEIALSYGPSISEGIRVMEKMIRQKRSGPDIEEIRGAFREELESVMRY